MLVAIAFRFIHIFFMKRGLSEGLAHLAREVNDGMAGRAVKEIDDYMDGLKDKRVLILGLSYRENVKEETKSTTWLLVDQLKQKQADVFVHDPMFTDAETKKTSTHAVFVNRRSSERDRCHYCAGVP